MKMISEERLSYPVSFEPTTWTKTSHGQVGFCHTKNGIIEVHMYTIAEGHFPKCSIYYEFIWQGRAFVLHREYKKDITRLGVTRIAKKWSREIVAERRRR